jgi:Cu(I)/Ag(I) efflux system periplasmic protein CusF
LDAQETLMKRLFALLMPWLLATSVMAQGPTSQGEVTKIDKAQGKITLRHDGIKHLDMPAMSMAFRVSDPKLLDAVAVGDKVRFTADKVGGNFTIGSLTRAP